MGIRKDLLVTEEIARIFRPQGDPLSSRVSDRLATPLALASSWKSKGAARRIAPATGCSQLCYCEVPKRIGLTMVSILAAISSAGTRFGD
jgi:hypothetical protein